MSPIGPAPRIATESPASISARSTPRRQHASGSSSAATSGARPRRHVVQVDRGDPFGHEEPICIRTGEELQVAALLAPGTAVAGAARRRVGGDHPAAVDEPAELVPERRRCLSEEDRVPAPVGLQIGAVGQRDLDLHEHLPGRGLRLRDVLDAQVARRVQVGGLHGANTTFKASPRR